MLKELLLLLPLHRYVLSSVSSVPLPCASKLQRASILQLPQALVTVLLLPVQRHSSSSLCYAASNCLPYRDAASTAL